VRLSGSAYGAGVSTSAPHRRTLWEEGRRPARLVALAAGLLVAAAVLLDLAVFDNLTVAFDIVFVLVCVGAALAVRPRDFFGVGVLPPLLMAATVAALAVWSRGAVADPTDGLVQSLVSGLAHHAGALVTGYALTLVVLALRQVAMRNAGTIRARRRSRAAPSTDRTPAHERSVQRPSTRPSGPSPATDGHVDQSREAQSHR
jgi:hypothetical protein